MITPVERADARIATARVDTEAGVKLSVVIVSYKNSAVLYDCLDSILKFNDIGGALEVIVVEQSPEGDLYEGLRRDYPWVVTLRHENRGFGAGNNAGARVANGRYLLFLNPDTVLVEPVFGFAIEKFEADSELGLFGVRLVDADGNRNQSFYFRKPYGLLRGSVLWRICDRFDWFMPRAMYITGADMFVTAQALRTMGGFDERMFMYFEETYFCERLDDLGLRIGYFPEKRIVHLEGKSGGGVEKFRRQLESLEVLCEDLQLDYYRILCKMAFDRKVKSMLGSAGDIRRGEIEEIERRLRERGK